MDTEKFYTTRNKERQPCSKYLLLPRVGLHGIEKMVQFLTEIILHRFIEVILPIWIYTEIYK